MKVIDLLNKIANGEEVPEKFRFAGQIFEKQGSHIDDEDGDSIFDSMCTDFSNINDEIEIIEENKPIKTIQTISSKWYSEYIDTYVDEEEKYSVYDEILMNKVNELIDKVNELEDK